MCLPMKTKKAMGRSSQTKFAVSEMKTNLTNGAKLPLISGGRNERITLIKNPTCKTAKIKEKSQEPQRRFSTEVLKTNFERTRKKNPNKTKKVMSLPRYKAKPNLSPTAVLKKGACITRSSDIYTATRMLMILPRPAEKLYITATIAQKKKINASQLGLWKLTLFKREL